MSKPNFFDAFSQRPDVAARQGGGVPGRTVPPQGAYQDQGTRQSPVVPGSRVGGQDTGNHLQDRMDDVANGGGSPLANYMPKGHNSNRGGQQQPQGQQQPAAGGAGAAPSQSPTPQPQPSIWDASPDLYRTAFSQQADHFLPSDITEEEYKAAFSGDFEKFKALQRKLNVHTASMTAANQTRITKAGLDKEFESFRGQLPKYQQEQQFNNLFKGVDHPLVQNPKTAPLLKATTQYFREEFPDASPEEIRQGVLAYMEDQLGSSMPQKQSSTSIPLSAHFDSAAYEGFE